MQNTILETEYFSSKLFQTGGQVEIGWVRDAIRGFVQFEYQVVDGYAIAEGDIVLCKVDEMRRLSKIIGNESPEAINVPEAYIINTGKTWSQKKVPYEIIKSNFDSDDLENISNAIKHVNKTTFICMEQRNSQSDFVRIIAGEGNHSRVGCVGGPQNLTLSSGGFSQGTVLHELNHAFGSWHEQSRDDRDSFVIINWNNIKNGKRHNFEKKTGSCVSAYDYLSIMHYGRKAFSNNEEDTIVTIDKNFQDKIGNRKDYTLRDYYGISSLYTPSSNDTPILIDVNFHMLGLLNTPDCYDYNAGEAIRMAHRWASGQSKSYVSAMPNFEGWHANCGVVSYSRGTKWKDVSYKDLNLDKSTEEYDKKAGIAIQAAHRYASKNGYVSGFPNFESWHDNCGIILLNSEIAEVRDVSYQDLGLNKPTDKYEKNAGTAIRAAHRYASKRGYVTAFPNFESWHDNCGIVFIKKP